MKLRLGIAALIAALATFGYCSLADHNPITGERQYVALTVQEEVALGQRTAPLAAEQFGGLLADAGAQQRMARLGEELLRQLGERLPYRFSFSVLADAATINAFALPGGPIFVTKGLLDRLGSEAQVAGVLAHEIGHVIERHSAEQLAKQQLTQGLAGAAAVAASDPENPEAGGALAGLAAQLVNLRHSRKDELESDRWGVRLLVKAGYDPRAMVEVMRVLAAAGGGNQVPEFFRTHPDPELRIRQIQAAIAEEYPLGLPDGLRQ